MVGTGKETDSVFERAIIFAANAHAGAKRKGTDIPYIVHPLEAAAIASTMTSDKEVLAAAVLHDVLEDTAATAEELKELFGCRVAELVQNETEDKRRDRPARETWKLRKQEMLDFLVNEASYEAKILALSDKLSNLRSIYRDIQVVGDKLWDRFNEKDKKLHGWMYRSVAEALKGLSGYAVWREYNQLVEKTFGSASSTVKAELERLNVTVFHEPIGINHSKKGGHYEAIYTVEQRGVNGVTQGVKEGI